MDYSYLAQPQGVQLPDPFIRQQRELTLAQAADARRVTQYQLERLQREDAAARGLGDAIPGIKNIDDDGEVMAALSRAPADARAGIAKYVTDQRKARADAAKDRAAAGESEWKTRHSQALTIGGLANYLATNPNASQQDLDAAKRNVAALKLDPSQLDPPPGMDPRAYWRSLAMQSVDAAKQIEQAATSSRDDETKRFHTNSNALAEAHLSESARHNRADEGLAGARLAADRRSANEGTLIQIGIGQDGQPIMANNKTAALVAAGPGGGQPYSGPVTGKEAFEKRAAEATDKLAAADRADKLIGMVEGNPRAFGMTAAIASGVPFIGSRVTTKALTPEEQQTRATVMREAAVELNRLYGAALSAGENKRAQTFIPDPQDPPEAIISKLKAARDWSRETANGGNAGATSTAQRRRGAPSADGWRELDAGVRIRPVSR